MTVQPKKDYIHTLRFICVHCGRERQVQIHEGMGIKVGDVIVPYAGGGDWGKCPFCRRAGLRAMESPPIQKKGPVGWKRK